MKKTSPSARSGNQQAKGSPKKNQTRVSRGRQARPTQSATIQINRQTRQSARETRKVKRSERRKMINKRDKDLLIFTYQQTWSIAISRRDNQLKRGCII
jgi:hypothetical protein